MIKTISVLLGLFLINLTLLAQEKNFRGWKTGDWVIAYSVRDQTENLKRAEMTENFDAKIHFIYEVPYVDIDWCKIEGIGDNYVLVTSYYNSIATRGQVNRKEIPAHQKIKNPTKFNLVGDTNLTLVEWPKNVDPPRPQAPWWSLFKK